MSDRQASKFEKMDEKREMKLSHWARSEKTHARVDTSKPSLESPSLEQIANWPREHPFMAHLRNTRIDGLRKEVDTLKTEVDTLKKELKETRETSQRMFNLFNFLTKNMYPDVDYYSDEESDGLPLTISDLDADDSVEDASEEVEYDEGPLRISDLDSESQYKEECETYEYENSTHTSEEYPEPPKLVRQSNHPDFIPPQNNYSLNLDDVLNLNEIISGMERLSINDDDDDRDTKCGYGETHVPEFFQKINPLDMEDFVSDERNYVGTDGIDYWDYRSQDSSRDM